MTAYSTPKDSFRLDNTLQRTAQALVAIEASMREDRIQKNRFREFQISAVEAENCLSTRPGP